MSPGIRFDWGAAGARAAEGEAGALVVVDVLSFSTAVTIMTGRGSMVYPHTWPSPDVEALSKQAHEEFMALELSPGAIPSPAGIARYSPEFLLVS